MLSPLISIATQVQSQPGVFALLLGSGVSTGAGLPTGWQIVTELVQRAASAGEPAADPLQGDGAIEAWWAEHGEGELGYSTVLAALAPTQAGRQAILERFFEPVGTEDDEPAATEPSKAHRAIARLVAKGYVKVILTTNFDRLLELALAEEGIQAQVISRPEAIAGMKPLAHASVTIIKLHGDYKDLSTLNTPRELSEYSAEWQGILAQVLDQYGLLIAGWSAEWDTALVHAIEASVSRRYPLYWDGRSSRGAAAQRLLHLRDGITIASQSADELFAELAESTEAIERLAETPVTSAVAVARLKRYLPDPVRRIDLYDLVVSRIEPIREVIAKHGARPIAGAHAYEDLVTEYCAATQPLLQLATLGVRHDIDGAHQGIWVELLERLVGLRSAPDGVFNEAIWDAQHLPALLTFYAMSAASVANRSDRLMVTLASEITWKRPFGDADPLSAAHILRPDSLLAWDDVNAFSVWNGTRWQQPPSHFIRHVLGDLVQEIAPGRDAGELFDDVEYRHALLVQELPVKWASPLTGEYRGDRHWGGSRLEATGKRFRAESNRLGLDWPWRTIVDAELEDKLTKLESDVGW